LSGEEPDERDQELVRLRSELSALRRTRAEQLAEVDPALHGLPTMVWVGDGAGRCEYVNPAWLAFRGTELEQELGLGWLDGVHPEDRELCLGAYQSSADTSEAPSLEYRLRRRDGAWRWMLDACGPQYSSDGTLVRYVGTVTDITEQVASRALAGRVQTAQRVESLSLLASGIANDFNNLLTGILGNVELALEDVAPSHAARPCLEDVALAARTASEMTAQLLTFAGRRRMASDEVDLNQVIEEARQRVDTAHPGAATIRLSLAEGLPLLLGDRVLLAEAVFQLAINAIQSFGGVPGPLELRSWLVEDGRVAFEVSDGGPGLDAATRVRAFEPYYTTRESGRGLGLAIVQGIAFQHGASVELDTAPGQGARFTIRFSRLADGAIPMTRPRPASTGRSSQGIVLLIDDDARVLRASRRILERRGLRVVAAEGGQAGLAQAEAIGDGLAVVVLDLTMPDLDGAEVLLRLRSTHPEIPVVLASGYAHDEVFSRVDPQDVSGFLHKPFTPNALEAVVRRAMDAPGPVAGPRPLDGVVAP
jgi:PAS domain S-box-containing protein